MTNLLLRLFVRDFQNTDDPKVRGAYGKLAGIVGMVCNVLLCAGKLTVGILSGSVAVTADAVNNLSDASSSLVTRAQLATFLHRYAGEPEGSAALNGFADQSKVDSWSKDAICWAIDVGILKGSRDGAGRLWLNPQDSATRAEVATILMRFIVNNT